MLDLEPIKNRLALAAPSPWYQDEDNWWGIRDKDEEIVALASTEHALRENNADFIANAPQDIAALVAEVEWLRAENGTLRRSAQVGRSGIISTGRVFSDA